jgi:hypothetical protein
VSIKIRPFMSPGGWWTSYIDYYRFAHSAHDDFLLFEEQIRSEERRLSEELRESNFPSEHLQHYILDQVRNLHNDAYRAAISCHLYACMSLEGFLNLYGVRRLGETFYQKNLERLGITEKLALIGVFCAQWDIDEHADMAKDFRELFDARNRLVHPKTKEFRPDRMKQNTYIHPSELDISHHIARLERCIDFFVTSDKSLPRDFLFPKT